MMEVALKIESLLTTTRKLISARHSDVYVLPTTGVCRMACYKKDERLDDYGLTKVFNSIKKGKYPFVFEITKYATQQPFIQLEKAFSKEFVFADRFYPSSKICSVCGTINGDLKLSERVFRCPHCSVDMGRYGNASLICLV